MTNLTNERFDRYFNNESIIATTNFTGRQYFVGIREPSTHYVVVGDEPNPKPPNGGFFMKPTKNTPTSLVQHPALTKKVPVYTLNLRLQATSK